ncbi:protein suex-1-like isoform X1 [Daphnia pulex]|uniref:protein suex-1-like isoform X1 n=2 Tax=Daphnia pulex TaxID=6669 RepID=UPI001EE00254|nr:protein suex-1-like isoform X1 [Daphnia pulex]XP_046442963.1 protein suex-1-like isoform X1 [Daphnia pulex]XP_046442964.1 protein suex-1-like isoform X1 [Daphnia pulex]XP_046442965.1 protein suex-1-like isoform X1 [Daphnia pulex]XP_046442966.1 protein suex-1-like isoform X1 [Daphnia pulex]XP_046442967.1 protein suex-1-like isoform X1 [Daphnia pulex]
MKLFVFMSLPDPRKNLVHTIAFTPHNMLNSKSILVGIMLIHCMTCIPSTTTERSSEGQKEDQEIQEQRHHQGYSGGYGGYGYGLPVYGGPVYGGGYGGGHYNNYYGYNGYYPFLSSNMIAAEYGAGYGTGYGAGYGSGYGPGYFNYPSGNYGTYGYHG